MLKTVLTAVIVVVVVAAALYLFANYVRRASMFFPEKYPTGNWESATAEFHPQDVWFSTRDQVKLHGWFFAANAAGAPLIIWFHGNAGNITERSLIADELRRRGVSVLLFDWRGYGKSEGDPTESRLFIDAEAVYDFAVRELDAHAERIALYGESLGGPYAAWLATRRRAHCVVIENSFPSLRDLGNALYAPVPLGYFAPCSLTTTRWLNKAGIPVLVMHGRRDQVIPFNLGMRLYEGLEVPKRLLVSETAGHSEMAFVEGERYYEIVTSFVKSL
ncbi:MAG: alpha/beta hydrolase [Thermoanaerobaculia bacterium]